MNGTEPHYEPHESTDVPRCTDSANADALRLRYGEHFRSAVPWDRWIAWDGRRWALTGAKHAVWLAAVRSARNDYEEVHATVKVLREEIRKAELVQDKALSEKLTDRLKYMTQVCRWHEQSQNASKIRATLDCFEPMQSIPYGELDQHPYLLNLQNGTLDLRTCELSPHDPEHLITQLAPVRWDESAKCPRWDAFIDRVTGGKRHLALFLQRIIGYSLTGVVDHAALFFHFGASGNNGKSTFLRTIQDMLGDYACAAPRTLLFHSDGPPPHPTELARLYGKRFVVCSEVEANKPFDIGKLKFLTGDDKPAVRRMNEDYWDLVPTHKLHLAGNEQPPSPADDGGFWRRMKQIPWDIEIPKGEVDPLLKVKLRLELPGILRRAAHGCLEYQRIGLSEPEDVLAGTAEYRKESDVVGQWLHAHCVLGEDGRCTRQALRIDYELWCKELGHMPLGAQRLAKRLRKALVEGCPVRDGGRVKDGWKGIRLKSAIDEWAEMPS